MAWTKKHTQLNDVLSDLVPNKSGINRFVLAAGLQPKFIDDSGNAIEVWNKVLIEADKRDKVDDLVKSVLDTYPENPFLKSALSPKEIDYSLSPDIDKVSKWNAVSAETLEVLTMGQSTLLPINFLSKGIIKSRSVAKVEMKTGTNRYNVGTGFLFKVKGIEDLFFITNFHVINRRSDIPKTRIIFDYEQDINGNSLPSKSFEIEDGKVWYCSPVNQLDTTVFRVKDFDNNLNKYGYIELTEIEISDSEFVNIIQHPGGEMKQISLYHNIVTYRDERKIQYLTDTLKGSSGSPVFNSDWEVVALHHSGSEKKENELELPYGVKSRNEGISINKIIEFVRNHHKS
jgi:V8-like Glu-specific endopeptidase